jgi:hypothetical protein
MLKSIIAVASLAIASTTSFAQASAPDGASAPVKHKFSQKVSQKLKAAKARHPAASAISPTASPDKKGGN